MKTNKILFSLTIIILLLFFIGCGQKKGEVKDPNADAVHVEVAKVVQEDFQQLYPATGVVEPIKSAEVSPDANGKIVKLFVQEGIYVKKGQVLVQLDDVSLSAQFDQAQAALKLAEANLEKARTGVRPQELEVAKQVVLQAKVTYYAATTDLMRTENLYKSGIATKQELDGANVRVKVAEAQYQTAVENLKLAEEGVRKEDKQAAEAGYEQAKATVAVVKDQLEKTKITSPLDGVVTKKFHEVGEIVSSGNPIFRVETVNPVKVVLKVPQEDAGQIKLGQLVTISLPTDGKVTGKVSLVSPAVEEQNRSFKIEVTVDNPTGIVRSGMFVSADILLATKKNAMIIPRAAVQKSPDGKITFVYVVQTGTAKKTPITVDLIQGEQAIIAQGITPGADVVIRGAERLTDNTRVKI